MERSLSWNPTSHPHNIVLFIHSLARSTLSKTLLELTSGYFSVRGTATPRSMRDSRTAAWVADNDGARSASRLSVIIPALVGARTCQQHRCRDAYHPAHMMLRACPAQNEATRIGKAIDRSAPEPRKICGTSAWGCNALLMQPSVPAHAQRAGWRAAWIMPRDHRS